MEIQKPPAGVGPRFRGPWLILLLIVAVIAIVLGVRHYATQFNPTLAWKSTATAAMTDAHEKNLPVLMVFTQDGCHPCMRLKSDELDSAEFEEMARGRLVLAELDVNAGRGNVDLFRRYGGEGTPLVVLTDAGGNRLARWDNRRPFNDWLRSALADLPPTTQPTAGAAVSRPPV